MYYFHATNIRNISDILKSGISSEYSGYIWSNKIKKGSKIPDNKWRDLYDTNEDVIIVFNTDIEFEKDESGSYVSTEDEIPVKDFTNIIYKNKVYSIDEFINYLKKNNLREYKMTLKRIIREEIRRTIRPGSDVINLGISKKISLSDLIDNLATKIFPKYSSYKQGKFSSGKYSNSYNYKLLNGVRIKQYDAQFYKLHIWYPLMKLLTKEQVDLVKMFLDEKFIETKLVRINLNGTSIMGTADDGSKYKQIREIYIQDEDRVVGYKPQYFQIEINPEKFNIQNIKLELEQQVSKLNFLKIIFDDISLSHKLKSTTIKRDSSNSHIGIGSQSSTKIKNVIHKVYDFRKFTEKYGESKLRDALDGTWFEKKYVKKIENGIIYTDESWTDTYD